MKVRLSRPARRASVRGVGLVLSLVVGALVLALLAYVVISGRGRAVPIRGGEETTDRQPAPSPMPPGGDSGEMVIQESQATRVQWADKDDPTRLVGELHYDELEPLEAGRFAVTRPRAWMELRSGAIMTVESERGRFFSPTTGRDRMPESGTLQGNVIVRLYEARPTGALASEPSPDRDVLTLEALTESLVFDGGLGELSTPDELLVRRPDAFAFEGTGLTLLYNEVAQRVELLHVHQGRSLAIFPKAKARPEPRADAGEVPPTGQGTSAGEGDAARSPAPPPTQSSEPADAGGAEERETLYAATINDDVVIEMDGRQVRADVAELLARTFDGSLRPDAIKPLSLDQNRAEAPSEDQTPATPAPEAGEPSANSASTPAVVAGEAGVRPTHPAGTVHLTWTGALVVKPLEQSPALLEADDVAVRLTAPKAGAVAIADEAAGIAGRASRVVYGATQRRLELQSDEPGGVELRAGTSGKLVARSLRADLGVGVAHVEGAGALISGHALDAGNVETHATGDRESQPAEAIAGAPEEQPRRIAWTEHADFVFATSRQGRMTSDLLEAIFVGEVRANDASGAFEAQSARAQFFEQSPLAGGDSDPVAETGSRNPGQVASSNLALRVLSGSGGVRVRDAENGMLESERMEATFSRNASGRGSWPDLVVARGGVRASQRGTSLRSEYLEVELENRQSPQTQETELRATRVVAREGVAFESEEGVSATADELDASPLTQVVHLNGPSASVAKDTTRITGPRIMLDGVARLISVEGVGTFTHEGEGGDARASWTSRMRFDDRAGELLCLGNTSGVWQPDAATVRHVDAESLSMWLDPYVEERDRDEPAGDAAMGQERARRVLRVDAEGRPAGEGGPAKDASVEQRTYVAGTPAGEGGARTLSQVVYLSGRRIIADDLEGTLSVPSAGTWLVVERSERAAGASANADPQAGGLGKGDSLFRWSRDMVVRRAEDRAVMRGDVRLTHLRAGDTRPTELECDELIARVDLDASGAGAVQPAPGPTSPTSGPGAQRPGGSGSASAAPSSAPSVGRLLGATALGKVWARSAEGKELSGNTLVYDAQLGTIDALADTGNQVTLFDPAAAAPLRAGAIRLNLLKNTFEVRDPSSVTIPR
ncbi:MAG: hypothetical protein SFZ23_10665 [Planctomycetota bacterium]|nr:hypothetical protein [Planctomycetota bacterium]